MKRDSKGRKIMENLETVLHLNNCSPCDMFIIYYMKRKLLDMDLRRNISSSNIHIKLLKNGT